MRIRNHLRIVWLAGLVCVAGCSLPNILREENLAFDIDQNQLVLTTVRVEGRDGRFIVATGLPRTVISSQFVTRWGLDRMAPFHLTLGTKTTASIDPNVIDLGPDIDAMIGADLLGPIVSIDYRREILASSGLQLSALTDAAAYPFDSLPSIPIRIDGVTRRAIVDTTIPDSLFVPASMVESPEERTLVDVEVGRVRYEKIDVRVVDSDEVRIGNRLLSDFLVAIDYEGKVVALWKY